MGSHADKSIFSNSALCYLHSPPLLGVFVFFFRNLIFIAHANQNTISIIDILVAVLYSVDSCL